jgi:hypothetical protein
MLVRDAGARPRVLIDRTIASQDTNERMEIAFSYGLDWELTERAMRGCGGYKGDVTRQLNPHNVYDVVASGAGKREAEAYFAAEIDAPISRHHPDSRAHREHAGAGAGRASLKAHSS